MSNSSFLQLHQPLNLNKLYIYSNVNYNYFTHYFNSIVRYSLFMTYKSGIITRSCFNEGVFAVYILTKILNSTNQPFLFLKQNLSKTINFNSLSKTRFFHKKNLLSLSTVSKNSPYNYVYNTKFNSYKTNFLTSVLPLFHPFIKKKPRTFSFLSKSFTKKLLKTQRLKKKIFSHRKFWFLHTILKLNKNINVYNIRKSLNFTAFLKTLKLKKKQLLKKKNYLMPRQNLFLNSSRLLLKGSKPLKIVLLRRMTRFYRRKFRKINLNSFNHTIRNKNLKYKFKLLKLKKRQFQFHIPTLIDMKFFPNTLKMHRTIRRGNSRLKLRRTKKYYLEYLQSIKSSTSSKINLTLIRYYRLSRVRYLNRFFRQNVRRYKTNFFIQPSVDCIKNLIHSRDLDSNDTSFNNSTLDDYYYNPYFNDTSTLPEPYLKKNLSYTQTFSTRLFKSANKILTHSLIPVSLVGIHRPVSITSKYRTPFILSTIGFIFLQNISTQTSSYIKSRFNRFRYSFLFKKDLKRYLLKKPGRLKLISSATLFSNYKTKYNRFGKPFINSYFSQQMNQISDNNQPLLVDNVLTSQNPLFSYKNPRKYTSYLGSFFKKEVRVKRIKFKPGYSRIWRNARETLNMSLNFNAQYQYRLTRHLNKLQHLSKQTQAYIYDLTLKNVLINSHFANDTSTALMFLNNGLIFVNGQQTSNANLNLFQNDFVQLIVNLKYYIIFKWLLNWNSSKRIRLRKLSKTKFKKFKMMANKQRSRNLPDWILTSRLKSFDIPKYLEVDFFTLSTFILYEPFLFNDLNSLSYLESRSEITNMYNWKYIN